MSVRRRFVLLTALRWASSGLLIPLIAVYMQSRGLTLAELGRVFAVYGIVVVLLELPSGGFADALGHRRALVVAGALDVASLVLLFLAHDVAAFAVAWTLQGVARALDSGPLEAWFVDASLVADRDADIETGLARAGMATGIAIASGSAITAAIATTVSGEAADVLAVPVAAAALVRSVDVLLIHRLLDDPSSGSVRPWDAVRAAPAVVRRGVVATKRSRALTALVIVEVLWGAGMVSIEMFAGPRLADLLGDATDAVAALGMLAAVGWGVQAAGSAATGLMVRLAGSPARAGAALRVVQGSAVAVAGLIATTPGLVVAYLGFYLVHGSSNAVHYGLVHRAARSGDRATILSLNSLAAQLGGVASSLGLGVVASSAGLGTTFAVGAVLLALAAPLYRLTGRDAD